MPSGNTFQAAWSSADLTIADPGTAKAIPNGQSGVLALTIASGVETNTLADPTKVGLRLTIYCEANDGTSRAITCASPYDETGGTVLTFNAAGEYVDLVAIKDTATTYAWRVVAFDGVTGPTLNVGGLIDTQGVADAIILDADGDTTISAPTDDQVDVEAGGVDIVKITASGMQTTSITATATTGGGTTGLIQANASFVVVTSDCAAKQCSLPTNVVGTIITVVVGANGFEMICADAGAKINDVTCGATNEAAIPADTHSTFTCISATEWILVNYTALGAVTTAIVPDGL